MKSPLCKEEMPCNQYAPIAQFGTSNRLLIYGSWVQIPLGAPIIY